MNENPGKAMVIIKHLGHVLLEPSQILKQCLHEVETRAIRYIVVQKRSILSLQHLLKAKMSTIQHTRTMAHIYGSDILENILSSGANTYKGSPSVEARNKHQGVTFEAECNCRRKGTISYQSPQPASIVINR